jgi:hypothetical protein
MLQYLLAVGASMLTACSPYTSTDKWPNAAPGSGSDTTIVEPIVGDITPIDSLLQTTKTIINGHASEWANSSLEMNYRKLTSLESPSISATNAYYPRIKKLSDGSYLLLYQQGQVAWNVYMATSKDFVTWTNVSTPLFQSEAVTLDDGTKDTRCFSSADAIVLSNGNILAFAAFRVNNGYKAHPEYNGIMMRRSNDNGKTWGASEIIYKGTTWEPYALELGSGELEVFFTDAEPNIGDSGTSLLRSMNNGKTWTAVGKVIRQKTGTAIDGSGKTIFSDQMPVAIQLKGQTKIAVATEVRVGTSYHLSMAWDKTGWAYAPLTGESEGPADRQLNLGPSSAAAPYLVQFPSGETVLSYNTNNVFTMQMGNNDCTTFGDGYQPFSTSGCWGAMNVADPHRLLAAFTDSYTSGSTSSSRIVLGEFILNHRLNATPMTPSLDAGDADWSKVADAFFIGSTATTQANFRFAYDSKYLYCLVERSDSKLMTGDNMELDFQAGDGKGTPLVLSFTPDSIGKALTCKNANIKFLSHVLGTFNDNYADKGYIIEMAIPLSLLNAVDSKVLFNATVQDSYGNDTFTGLTSNNYSKWLPIVLKDEESTQPIGSGDNGKGPDWKYNDGDNPWK